MRNACEFCGQVVEHDADREAWEVCRCEEATAKRRQREVIARAIEGAQRIFGSEAENIGFTPVDESVMVIIKRLIEDVGNRRIGSVTVKLVSGETVAIKMDGMEISIKRKEQRTAVA